MYINLYVDFHYFLIQPHLTKYRNRHYISIYDFIDRYCNNVSYPVGITTVFDSCNLSQVFPNLVKKI